MKKRETVLPRDVQALLRMAQREQDPVLREKCLLLAEEMEPENLQVQRALLMLGNLARRDGKTVDYSVIKCYLLHAFEHPELHPEEEQKRMAEELFRHPRLQKCLSLSPDPDAFLRAYLDAMCRDYLHLFIEGQREHGGGLWGFQTPGRRIRGLSKPCADVLVHVFLSPFLTEGEARLLSGVFYRASLAMLGESKYLDMLLPDSIRERIG